MIRVVLEEGAEKSVKALPYAKPGTIQRRCNSCGLEWESTHYAEACPLRELERAFLPEDWFVVSSDAIV